MIRYNVRSRYLVDVVDDIKKGKLVLAPYFQRKLVWRDAHKSDFIETILLGYPFPEIFIARGEIDVDRMTSTSCVVDGQQRMNAIREFIDGELSVGDRKYGDLPPSEKENVLKYEIAIIDLDLPNNDPQIIDIFKRLNRTFYALSAIEKQATEYASSEFMLVAKLLCGEIRKPSDGDENVDPEIVEVDPNVSSSFVDWANQQNIIQIRNLILNSDIFSKYEISRMVHLAFTLNLIATHIAGYYTRNERVSEYLNLYKDEVPDRQEIVKRFNDTAQMLRKTKLVKKGFWAAKSNIFTLFLALAEVHEKFPVLDMQTLVGSLKGFASNPPGDYALAAREGVNNKQERLLRYNYVKDLIGQATPKVN